MKTIIALASLCLALASPMLASKVIFIQDFQNNTEDKKYDQVGKSLADMIISDIVALKINSISVVERKRIESLLSELKLQQSEYFDQATTQQMGRGLGANYALAGSFTVMNGVMRLDARLIDIATSKIHSSFKTKGKEDAVFDLEAELVKKIGKELELDFGDISSDKLSAPKQLDTLVKYADADRLMQKGDYKEAAKVLGEVRESEPEFKLGKEAYKEAMRKLYAAKEKRDTSFADNMEKLQASVFKKIAEANQAKDPERALAYSIVLNELYYLRLQKIGGLARYKRDGDEPGPEINAWSYDFQRAFYVFGYFPPCAEVSWEKDFPKKTIHEDKIEDFKKVLNLYIENHLSCINQLIDHISNKIKESGKNVDVNPAFIMHQAGFLPRVDAEDGNLINSMDMKLPYAIPDRAPVSQMKANLAHFLLFAYDFAPAPYQIDKKYEKMGWELLDQATKEALDKKWPIYAYEKDKDGYREDWACKIMEMHAALLISHGRTEDAIAKWQEILDNHPTYGGFKAVEGKIIKALE